MGDQRSRVPGLPGSGRFFQCIAVSQTDDPVSGGYFLYAVQHEPSQPTWVGDYPKMALWTEPQPGGAYHLTVNLFDGPSLGFRGVRVFAFDRAAMLNGDANPTAIAFTAPLAGVGDSYSFVPANFRTGDPPPAGRDEMVLAIDSPASGGVSLDSSPRPVLSMSISSSQQIPLSGSEPTIHRMPRSQSTRSSTPSRTATGTTHRATAGNHANAGYPGR